MERVWTIPPTRMKAKREHRGVPLCRRAVEILDAARTLGDTPIVFPTPAREAVVGDDAAEMLQYLRIAAAAHGFPSATMFSTARRRRARSRRGAGWR